MQAVISCDECGQRLVSAWPFGDPGTLLHLSGYQDPELDTVRVPNYPGPMVARGVVLDIRPEMVIVRVSCPDCLYGGGDLRIARPIPDLTPREKIVRRVDGFLRSWGWR